MAMLEGSLGRFMRLGTESQVFYLNDQLAVSGFRRLREPTANIWVPIVRAFYESGIPQSVRQVFYKVSTYGAVPKTEAGYRKIAYHLKIMREREIIPYVWLADSTRWMRKPTSYRSLEDALQRTAEYFRRDLWSHQEVYVEIWCEKDALSGILYDVTRQWDTPLMVSRGFSSTSFIYQAAQTIIHQDKPTYIYYFGDHDPSGVSAREDIERKLRNFGASFHFETIAVLPEQIEAWGLPTRPTKRTDSRSKNWHGDSVELDAIPADALRSLASEKITSHIDPWQYEQMKKIEEQERQSLTNVIDNLVLVPNNDDDASQ
jgi:hypothetical protein